MIGLCRGFIGLIGFLWCKVLGLRSFGVWAMQKRVSMAYGSGRRKDCLRDREPMVDIVRALKYGVKI